MPDIKQELYALCREYVAKGIAAAQQAIADAREAAAGETKSSAGDKYETTREMMQQEIDLNSARLAEQQKLKATLDTIDPQHTSSVISSGSVVTTGQGDYFISISVGKLNVGGNTYYALSAASPLGSKLIGRSAGDSFLFNGKEVIIKNVY
ncbi:MAG TPA: hypothetical protein VEB40_03915 [Flavipsychrobacter sp.]|nr:hypothetical protein [Flavipsychrobacter sp.]